jgi:hypothetical protein
MSFVFSRQEEGLFPAHVCALPPFERKSQQESATARREILSED